jgi:hypothetical protein
MYKTMKKYQKTDQEYIDDYDRYTIKRLKELEKDSKVPLYYNKDLEDLTGAGNSTTWKWDDQTSKYIPTTIFFDTAIKRAQNKEASILSIKSADENKDRLIANTPVPTDIKCNKCGTEMFHESYYFKENDTLLFFVFSCPNKHPPKKVLYPDGIREWVFKVSKCEKCGGELDSVTVEKENYLKFTDTCKDCGDISISEYTIEPDQPITEEDRKKYCTDWKGRKTFAQDLEAISDFMKYYEETEKEKKEKENYGVDKIERVNVPQLELRLAKASEESGFIKFKFESTSTKGFVIVTFSTQDPTDRNDKESVKKLGNGIKEILLPTNWRLMSEGINYRLGVLSGRLKAFEDDEGLLKIAKEIIEHSKK